MARLHQPFLYYYYLKRPAMQGWVGREQLTPHQSEDPSSTMPTHRRKEEKRHKLGQCKRIGPALETRQSLTP